MKKGYLYLIFITLSVVVVFSIALVFKLTTTTSTTEKDALIANDTQLELQLSDVQNYDGSWIQKLSVEKNQKEYLYPIQKFNIEFN